MTEECPTSADSHNQTWPREFKSEQETIELNARRRLSTSPWLPNTKLSLSQHPGATESEGVL